MPGGDAPRERHLEVVRTARYWTLGDADAGHEEVWIVLHGYMQLARRFLRRFRPVAGRSRLVVAPEGLSRAYVAPEGGRGAQAVVGATWMTREDRDHEIRDYVAYLDRLSATLRLEAKRLTVLGFSQGVATAWRWATYGSGPRPARLLQWAGTLPPDLDMGRAAGALAGSDVVLIRGAEDPGNDPDRWRAEEERLSAAGIVFRVVTYEGGHDIEEQTLLGLAEG